MVFLKMTLPTLADQLTVHPESGVELGDIQQQGEQSLEHISNLPKVYNNPFLKYHHINFLFTLF